MTETEKNRREMLERTVLPLLRGVKTPQDARAAVQKLGGARRVFSFCVGALTLDPEAHRAPCTLLLDAIPQEDWETPGTFHGFTGMLLYRRGREALPFHYRHRLEECFREWLPFYLAPCYDFCGVNDNTPAMIMTFLFLYGEQTGDADALQTARRRLAQFERLLADRDFPSEYNSPTYLAITIHALAVLSNLAENGEIRARARMAEGKLWHGALLFFDREASTLAGPYSRSYENGDRAETTQMRVLFDLLFGDRLRVRPFRNDDYPRKREGELWAEGAMMAAEPYHCPAALLRRAWERRPPFRVSGVTECSPSADDYLLPDCPAGEWEKITAPLGALREREDLSEYAPGTIRATASFREGCTLGTATRGWHNGAQSRSFFALLKRPLVRSQEDVTAVFCALSVNERGVDDDDLSDGGRCVAFQTDRTAMVLYAPKCAEEPISSVALRLFFTNCKDALREVRCGIRPLRVGDRLPLTRDPVCLSFGNVFVSVLPLTEEGEWRIEERRRCLSLCIDAAVDAPRVRARMEQKLCRMGFVFSVMTREEAGTFEEFCAAAGDYTLSDELCANLHTRFAYERRVDYACGGETLSAAYSPVNDGVRYLRANGKCVL